MLLRVTCVTSAPAARWLASALEPLASGPAMRAFAPPAARLLSQLPAGPESSLEWQEFRNKWEIIDLVENSPSDPLPLRAQVDRARALEPFFTLWAIEGIGQRYADEATREGQPVRRLLTGEAVRGVPAGALPMLHAGMGLTFASALLDSLPGDPADAEVRAALQQFVVFCRANSSPGYAGAALESLGLAARFSFSHLIPLLDRHLCAIDRRVAGYFWHGVGRAIYFLPQNSLPSCELGKREFEMAALESPHELGYLNTLAGLTWAVTLVNMRQPRILEAVVRAVRELLPAAGAFANGVFSATRVRLLVTPSDPYVAALCSFSPDARDADFVALWCESVKTPCERALRSPVRRPESLFQYERAA